MCRLMMVLLLALSQGAVLAGELGLIINGKAIHLEKEAGETYNEKNWGAGLQISTNQSASGGRVFAQVAGFEDSNFNTSYYAGIGYRHRLEIFSTRNEGFTTSVGLIGFAMYRETEESQWIFPGILPLLSFATRPIAVNMTYVPEINDDWPPLIFIQGVVRLGEF